MQKKRHMCSTTLKQSLKIHSVFEIWKKIHGTQQYDMIQNYLNQYLKHFGQSNVKPTNQYAENQAEHYYS